MTYVINGPNGGYATIFGNTSGNDIINAFDFYNTIISGGANDQIFTGAGLATVNLGAFVGVTDTVNVGGAYNSVYTASPGQTGSSLTVQGGSGHNAATLVNTEGTNSISLQGFYNTITVNGDATNLIFAGAGHDTVLAGKSGDGNFGYSTTINEAGTNNTVTGGDQDFRIVGGQGYDVLTLGNGDNTITESGLKDRITLGTGNNTITDFGGSAFITFVGSVVDDPLETDVTINLGGTNNFVRENNWATHSARDFTITGGSGNGTFILGDGEDNLTTSGANNFIQMGTPNNLTSPYDTPTSEPGDSVVADGNTNTIVMGDGNNLVHANGDNDTVTLGNGASKVTANGVNDKLVAGNGGNNITANGNGDAITLGNGSNTLVANGDTDHLTLGNGSNTVTAGGNGDVILLGTGNNTVSATGDSDMIASLGGKGTFTLGSDSTLSLTASSLGTTVNATGVLDSILLSSNSNAAITDSPFGGSLGVTINASGAANAGKVSIAGFQNDPLASIDLHGFAAITNFTQLQAVSSSDGMGGTLIHLGTGSLDLLATATLNQTQFNFA